MTYLKRLFLQNRAFSKKKGRSKVNTGRSKVTKMGFFGKIIWCYKFQEKQLGRSKVTTHPSSSNNNNSRGTLFEVVRVNCPPFSFQSSCARSTPKDVSLRACRSSLVNHLFLAGESCERCDGNFASFWDPPQGREIRVPVPGPP